MKLLKPILLCLALGALTACERPAAPLTPEAVRKINEAIDAGTLKTQLSKAPPTGPENRKILGRHMNNAFERAGYDADKTLQALLTGNGSPEKQAFAKQSGLYRVMDSLVSGNRDEITAWIESGVLTPETAERFTAPAGRTP